jgi:transcriptional regulator with XRE-family HTH domain
MSLMPSESGKSPRTGHSEALRSKLRAARERRGLTQPELAQLITEELKRPKPLAPSALSQWETFDRHPRIDDMAAWARVLGLRLVVELDDAQGKRIPVMLSPEVAEVAREIEAADEEDRQWAIDTIRRMFARKR